MKAPQKSIVTYFDCSDLSNMFIGPKSSLHCVLWSCTRDRLTLMNHWWQNQKILNNGARHKKSWLVPKSAVLTSCISLFSDAG